MSNSLQEQWPGSNASFEDHEKFMHKGIEVVAGNLILPGDQRFETAYALQISGRGQKSSVGAQGPPATGKTSFGDLMYGVEQRVEVSRDDIDDTLYGYPNPIKPEQIVPGKMVGLVAENPTAYLNELSHLPNTGSLHRLWDADVISVNAEKVPLRDIAIYITTNFPDGTPRVHELDEALLSRLTIMLLTGDHSQEDAIAIQGYNAVKEKDQSLTPILPVATTRRAIHEKVTVRYPIAEYKNPLGKYVVGLIDNLNATGLIMPVSSGDARIGEGLYDTARARMFLDGVKANTFVSPKQVAEIAGLVLPTLCQLSHVARSRLIEATGGRRPSRMEQAIAVRRLIAHTAFKTLFEEQVLSSSEQATMVDKAVSKFSYANPEAANFDVDRALFNDSAQEPKKAQEQNNGKRSLFRRSRSSK
jgi:hypothetical protein